MELPVDLQASAGQDYVRLTLPVPPSVNHQYATVNGRRLLSARGRTFKDLVGQQILLALAQSGHRDTLRQRLQGSRLALSVRFFFASALRRDVDGGLKITQDAICEHLGVNDNRVVELHVYKHQDRDHPRMELQLSVLSADTPNDPGPDQPKSPPARCR
ncbi:MAG: RusA family crossover junction endodeoxyribonuclease [Nitrospiraceae bacterium]|mgnify:CR=1 FL=1|nr:RusA family crossover junction endodeoxyribonuclease [Nitrospiraceae bacterium]